MSKIIDKFNIYILYSLLFIFLSIFVFFNFIIRGNVLFILEIFFAGLSFIFYSSYNKKSKFATAVGSIIYTFSGFMLYAVIKNPVTAFATISFPLVLLGIDNALKKDNYILFVLTSIIAVIPIMWDSYPVYLVAFFSILYTFIKYFNEYKGKKRFCVKFIKLLLLYVITLLLTSFILTHSFNIFQNVKINPDFSFTFYDFDYIIKTFYMNSATAFWCKSYILPIVISMLPIAALNFKKNKENRTWILYFLLLVILFVVPYFSYILNGFTFEPNKWGFIFSFVLAYLVTVNIRNDLIYSPKEFKFAKKMLILYLIVWFIFKSHAGTFALSSIVFAFIYLIILLARSLDYKELKNNQQFKYAQNLRSPEFNPIKERIKIILVLALCANVLFFSWHLYSKLNFSNDFSRVQYSIGSNYKELSFEYKGKNKKKILKDYNKFNFTKKYKSIKLEISDYVEERTKLYLVISNLKFSKNNQYTITAKYDDINTKYSIRDFVKTPSYIKVPDAVLYLGKYTKSSNSVKLTLSTGEFTFDSIKLLAVSN